MRAEVASETECNAAARHLRALIPEIVETYVARAREELEAARQLDRESLIDSLPDVLANICDALEHGARQANAAVSFGLGAAHGRIRADQPYSVDDIVVEYGIVSRILLSVLRRDRESRAVAVVVEAIHRALASAIREFTRLRDDAARARTMQRDEVIAELTHSRMLLETVIRRLPTGVSIIDLASGETVYRNEAIEGLLARGMPPELLREEHLQREVMYRVRGGETLHLVLASTAIHDATGAAVAIVASVLDITAQVRARAELGLVADSVSVHLLHLDRDERILFANKAAAEMWGRSREEMIGKTVREITDEATQRRLEVYTRRVLAGETVSYETPFVTGDGETRIFLNTYTPDRGPDGDIRGFIATGVDITERMAAEQRLRSTVESLHEERALREQFVATLSHDLRTPLSAAKMSAELLLRGGDPSRLQLLPSRIAHNLERVDAMLRDLLDANSLQAGERLPLDISACVLDDLARATLADLSSIHGNRFVLRSPSRIEGYWSCDGVRRILENLCTNAVKYGVPLAPVTVSLERTADEVEIRVHNQGPPIPGDEQPPLFEPFRRSPSARGQKGWGLGLPLVKGIAEAHGGRIAVASAEDSGTTFTVTLPVDARSMAR